MIKIKCLRDYGISLKKGKVYDARQMEKGWFAFIDETGEEYAYPPHIFEIVEQTEAV
jgi:hypothetical protein